MITADTITDEQIDRVWRMGCDDGIHGNPDTMHAATVAKNTLGDFSEAEQRSSRARCAEILNARSQPMIRSLARGYPANLVRPRPVAHIVTVTPEEQQAGVVSYRWSCSCGNACGRQDTDAEARAAARAVCGASVEFTTRAEMPFEIARVGKARP